MKTKMIVFLPNDPDSTLEQLIYFSEEGVTDYIYNDAQSNVRGGAYVEAVIDVDVPSEIYPDHPYTSG